MRSSVRALVVCLGLLLAGSGSAGTLTITYDLVGGSVNSPATINPIPLTAGSFTLTFVANGTFTKVSGPATLNTLFALGSNVYSLTPNAIASRLFLLTLPGGAPGTGTAGSAFSASPGFFFSGSAPFHCAGPGCPGFGFASSNTYPNTFTGTGLVLHFSVPGTMATGSGSGIYFRFGAGGSATGTGTFIGQEVNRVFVPEPQTATLLALGLLGLGAAGAARRSRRR